VSDENKDSQKQNVPKYEPERPSEALNGHQEAAYRLAALGLEIAKATGQIESLLEGGKAAEELIERAARLQELAHRHTPFYQPFSVRFEKASQRWFENAAAQDIEERRASIEESTGFSNPSTVIGFEAVCEKLGYKGAQKKTRKDSLKNLLTKAEKHPSWETGKRAESVLEDIEEKGCIASFLVFLLKVKDWRGPKKIKDSN
jgi:hypothetical protein